MNTKKFKILFSLVIALVCYPNFLFAQELETLEDIERRNVLEILTAKEAVAALENSGFKIEQYVINRGETWESIARKFNVTEELLHKINATNDHCYAGMEINVPTSSTSVNDISAVEENDALLSIARRHLENNEYGKARKEYNKIISVHPSMTAYYERAYVNYKDGKLKQASEDLCRVQTYSGYSEKYPDTDNLYSSIISELDLKKEKRNQFWTSFIGGVLMTGLEVGNAYLNAKYGPTYSSPMGNYSPSFFGSSGSITPLYNQQVMGSMATNGITIPDCLDFTKYDFSSNWVFTYDQNGNPMISNPGLANTMNKMNSDFASYMYNSGLFNSAGNYGRALETTMVSSHNISRMQNDFLATPHYAVSENDFSTNESGGSISTTSKDSKNSQNNYAQVSSLSHTYDNYVSQLISMKTGLTSYDSRAKESIQSSMKRIREKLNNKYNFPLQKSSLEDW